jgi:hypothetical protein
MRGGDRRVEWWSGGVVRDRRVMRGCAGEGCCDIFHILLSDFSARVVPVLERIKQTPYGY